MMALRPMVVDNDMTVLGGNMRLKALQHLGYKEIPDEWVKKASELTDDEKRRFIIADNVSGGEWDWDTLANEWDEDELKGWGLELPDQWDYSDKNKEIDIDGFDDEMIIKLKYTEDEYIKVKEQLSQIAATPEQAVWKLLNNE